MILDGEVAMLQAQVERLQEQLTESDHDRIANITRLTGQVARMKDDVSHYRQYIDELKEDIRKSDAQRDELQGMLTACEEERKGVRYERDRAIELMKAAQDRVRVLEGAIERIDFANRQHEDVMRGANGFTRTIRDEVIAALTPTPPAETPAHWKVFIPTTDRERMGTELCDRIAGHISRLESENDRLRADLATAKEEIARLTKFLDARNAEIEQFDVRFLRQYAQLGRAVALIRDMRTGFMGDPHKPGCARECCKFVTAANAILADADSKVSK